MSDYYEHKISELKEELDGANAELAKLKELMSETASSYSRITDARGYVTQKDIMLLAKLSEAAK